MSRFEVRSYTVNTTSIGEYAFVMLYDNPAGNASTHRARLNFKTSGFGDVSVSGNMITVGMHINLLDNTIDLLRNEKPIYFNWYSAWAGISTGNEPVGEEEVS